MNSSSDATPDSTTPNTPKRPWVWRSTPESIAAGQISIAAIAEIPFAFCLFWGIASITAWPWFSLLLGLAAPFLLLRSEQSIAYGAQLFTADLSNDRKQIRTLPKIFIGLFSFIVFAIGTYFLAEQWLTGYQGWPLFWHAALVGLVAILIAFAVAIASVGPDVGPNTGPDVGLAAAVVSAVAGAVAGVAATSDVSAVVGVAATSRVVAAGVVAGVVVALAVAVTAVAPIMGKGGTAAVIRGVASILVSLSVVLGFFSRSIVIRLWATARYFYPGLQTYTTNCPNTLWRTDIWHLPELIPYPINKKNNFSIVNLVKHYSQKTNESLGFFFIRLFIPIIYIPAMLYRWNIKANFWLWGTIAWAFSPIRWNGKVNQERMRSSTAFWVEWPNIKISILLLYCAWLLWPWLPDDIKAQTPTWLGVIQKYLPESKFNWRFVMEAMLALNFSVLIYQSSRIRSAHAEALKNAVEWWDYQKQAKEAFEVMARSVHRWVRINIAWMVIILGVVLLKYVSSLLINEELNQLIVWAWLEPWL